jgi:ABC-2 type transport system ATP-binding protein
MDKAIIVDHLSKQFTVNQGGSSVKGAVASLFLKPNKKIISAVKDLSFTIQKGELVGFIGPNGAGKTTTMKMLSGLIYPTSGFVSVLDFDPFQKSRDFLKQISLVMGQKNQLWWDLPVINSFEFNKAVYEIKEKEYKKNLDELVSLLGVSSLLNTQVRKLSLGQRMKMELIASLIYKPKVLFLDEPTIGLDLVAQQNLRDFIYEYNKKNEATVLLTSHNMNDLSDLARRVIIINEGELVFDGALDDITVKFAQEKIIKATLSEDIDPKKLSEIGVVNKYVFPYVYITVPRSTVAFAAAELLQKFPVIDLNIEELPIEEVVRKVFEGGLDKK